MKVVFIHYYYYKLNNMGIQGLISFVDNATESIEISKLSGKTVAIDSYCWLHKGAFSCAEKLAIGEKTTQYVKYCTNYLNLLLYNRIKPIMVFDGRHLPAKAAEETNRREERKKNRKLAAQFVRTGQRDKARRYIAASIDITHEMALELIKTCRTLKIDCIVAPYEADAQLAFLNISGIADCVITEDSDLILFGCKKVLFKLQKTGDGLLFDSEKLPSVMGLPPDKYNFSLFRRMCILSGCDYLPSLPGIGLAKAKKFILRTRDLDISESIKNLGLYLNMSKLKIPDDYIRNFLKAEACFQYQFVYDPRERKVVRLTEPPEDISKDLLSNSGKYIDDDEAFQHALGNIDPFSKKQMDTWNPDNVQLWPDSIWKLNESNIGKEVKSINTSSRENKISIITRKIIFENEENSDDILNEYRKAEQPPSKKQKIEVKKDINTISDHFKLFPVRKTVRSSCDKFKQNEEDNFTFILNHKKEETVISRSKTPESFELSQETSPKIKSKFSPQEKSPILDKNTKRKVKSKFLPRAISLGESETTTAISSFFKTVTLSSSNTESIEIETNTSTKSYDERSCLQDTEIENNSFESIENDDEKPSCSQSSDIENKFNPNSIEELAKTFIKQSPIKKLASPKQKFTKKHLVPARRQGLSRTQNIKNFNNVNSQKLLTQFGFVKKPEFKL